MSDLQNPPPPEPRESTLTRGPSLGDRLGIGGLMLALISIAASILWPDQKLVGWLFLSGAIALSIVWIILEVRGRVKSNKRRSRSFSLSKKAGVIIVGVVLTALATLFALWARPSVHPPFQEAYDLYRDKLGQPERKAEALKWAYHAQHERATVILLSKIQTVYLLYHNSNKELVGLTDEGIAESTESYWWDDEEVIKKFIAKFGEERGTPSPGLYPPYGPIAKGWYTNPDDWSKIGWRRRHCMYKDETVYVQRFQHGLIVGSLRHIPEQEESQYGRIFILLTDEHRWEDVADTSNAGPRCHTPYSPPKRTE